MVHGDRHQRRRGTESLHTTVLLTVEETLAALQKAGSIRYRPPGKDG